MTALWLFGVLVVVGLLWLSWNSFLADASELMENFENQND